MAQKTKPTQMGANRTGIGTSPFDAQELVEGARKYLPSSLGSEEELNRFRLRYSSNAGPLGTIPPPAKVKGLARAVVEAFKGHKAGVLIDKLAERLAFERGGVRLYDAILVKAQAGELGAGTLKIDDLQEIRDEEARHARLVWDCIEQLGADPTAMTPGADLVGVASSGFVQAVTDPRTTLTQALEVILFAELGDNDSWQMLISLVEGMGMEEMASDFRQAFATEQRHLQLVRRWLSERLEIQAGAEVEPPRPHA